MVKVAEKKKARNPWLPFIGFMIAVSVGVIAYFGSPLLTELIKNQLGEAEFNSRLGSTSQGTFEAAVAVFIWLVLFAVVMMIVAAAIGEDPEEEGRLLRPREGDAKAAKQYLKKLDKLEKRRGKQMAAKRAAKEREEE